MISCPILIAFLGEDILVTLNYPLTSSIEILYINLIE